MSEKKKLIIPPPPVANVLPPRARQALVAAANIEPTKGRTESQERLDVLHDTIREIKELYPTYFKQRGE